MRNIPDTDLIKAHVDHAGPKRAIVAGAGFIGLEMAENLVMRGIETVVVELADQLMPPLDPEIAKIVEAHVTAKGVTCITGTGISAIRQGGKGLSVALSNDEVLDCDMVLLATGVRPENGLATAA